VSPRREAGELRHAAEASLAARAQASPSAKDPENLPRLVHELQVHQIELEMQNDELELQNNELQLARAELEAREATLSSILGATPDLVCAVDHQFRILFTNRAHAGRSIESVLGTDATAYFAPEHQSLARSCIRRVFATGTVGRFEATAHGASDEPRWYETVAAPVCRDAEITSVTLLSRDITARRKASQAMVAAKAEAELANSAKSRFLAAASHDLRQPLSALTVYATVLEHKVAPADRPVLSNMKDCIGSLSELLINLLDLSKLEAGVVTPNVSDISLAGILSSLESVHAPEAQLKGLRLHCATSNLTVRTDPILFTRIVGNLIGNAIRYTERGGVLIGCRRRRGKRWVEVWDTGIGIPADKTAEIFEEFKQLGDDARTRGSGLGLAIVAKTGALLGLEVNVRSRPGRGSVFAIELPPGQERAMLAREPCNVAHRPLRIALVDDLGMVRRALGYALQAAGHQVVAAASGKELCAELGSLPPDVVVSDYRLAQGETGFDVVASVRATMGADLPAILITGDTDPKLLRSMADRGIIVLHKPLDMEVLQTALKDLTPLAG
jgi:PAS domain S-box-containing protein